MSTDGKTRQLTLNRARVTVLSVLGIAMIVRPTTSVVTRLSNIQSRLTPPITTANKAYTNTPSPAAELETERPDADKPGSDIA